MSQKVEDKMPAKRHHENSNTKKAGIAILTSNKTDIKTKTL